MQLAGNHTGRQEISRKLILESLAYYFLHFQSLIAHVPKGSLSRGRHRAASLMAHPIARRHMSAGMIRTASVIAFSCHRGFLNLSLKT